MENYDVRFFDLRICGFADLGIWGFADLRNGDLDRIHEFYLRLPEGKRSFLGIIS